MHRQIWCKVEGWAAVWPSWRAHICILPGAKGHPFMGEGRLWSMHREKSPSFPVSLVWAPLTTTGFFCCPQCLKKCGISRINAALLSLLINSADVATLGQCSHLEMRVWSLAITVALGKVWADSLPQSPPPLIVCPNPLHVSTASASWRQWVCSASGGRGKCVPVT